MNTLTLAFQAIYRCSHCDTTLYAGWDTSLRCYVCERVISLQEYWKRFTLTHMLSALTAPKDQILERRDAENMMLFYQRAEPICQSCNTKIDTFSLEISDDDYISCSNCQRQISARKMARSAGADASPWVEWIIHEKTCKKNPSPIWFSCLHCGQGLLCNGSERILSCERCHQKSFVPYELWLHFKPQNEAGWFFVIFEFSHRPEIELRIKNGFTKDKKEAAELAATEQEALLLENEHNTTVLEALANNPITPASMLTKIYQWSKALPPQTQSTLSVLVAKHPKTSLQTLEDLVVDGSRTVRKTARNHPTYIASGQEPPPDPDEKVPNTKFRFQDPVPGEDPYRASPQLIEQVEDSPTPDPEEVPQISWRNRIVDWFSPKKK